MNHKFNQIVEQISRVVLGKEDQIRLALTCLLAKGHLLIEDIPGIGKTTLAKVLSKCLGLNFRRIQCTSDMLPGDILGVSVFERKSSSFLCHGHPEPHRAVRDLPAAGKPAGPVFNAHRSWLSQ